VHSAEVKHLINNQTNHLANSKFRAKAVDKTMETFVNESKSVEITDFTEFHRNGPNSRKMANFTENVTVLKS